MLHDGTVYSKLIINGFTINPIRDVNCFKQSISGLLDYDYKQKHICDFDGNEVHTNYLNKGKENIFVSDIITENGRGLIGFVSIKNGYYTLRITYDEYPARIQFDLSLDEKMFDPNLIIDHLCAPAVPFDGFGMFDYTYSLNTILKPKSIVSDVFNNIRYTNNEPFNISLFNSDDNYKIILNQLEKIHCYFCENVGEYFGFINESRRVVTVCKEHLNNLNSSHQENGNNFKDKDVRNVRKYINQFVKVLDKDKDGNIISKHIKGNDGTEKNI
jgi:hypothetical protein